MEHENSIHLLKECDAGTKMAVSSIDEVLESVNNPRLKQLLTETKAHHEQLGNEIHSLLNEYGSKEKEPNPMAKGMSWLKTNVKLTMDECEATVADLIIDGCNMGVKSLHKYLHQYAAANETVKDIAHRLISIEEQLCKELYAYL